jgi:hypothetical protein
MELSSELIEIETEKKGKVWASLFARLCVACVFVLIVSLIAIVLAAGFSATT